MAAVYPCGAAADNQYFYCFFHIVCCFCMVFTLPFALSHGGRDGFCYSVFFIIRTEFRQPLSQIVEFGPAAFCRTRTMLSVGM